ncbi:hypothetical protein K8R30_03165 [archaeon]|nr:hypothetical protein [archaeon]
MEVIEEIVGISLMELEKSPGAFEFEKRVKRGIFKVLGKGGFVDVSSGMVEKYFRATYWELFCNGSDLARHVQARKYGDRNRVELMKVYGEEDIRSLGEVVLRKYGSGVSNYLGRD